MNVHSAYNDKPDINIHCLYRIKLIISGITIDSVRVIIPNICTVIIQGINVHSAHNNKTRPKYTLSVPYKGNNIRHNFRLCKV
jgi:hypothetical protein